jgi:hypothetical protein
MVDPLYVIETARALFVRKCFEKAAQLAALAAPYRHPRLSAVKHVEHSLPVCPRIKK